MKRSIDVEVGVVDADYHSELAIILINNSDDKFRVEQGTRLPS